jgi:hypothetical protein
MVLTGAVPMSQTGPTRRRLVLAAAAGVTTTLSGCGLFDHDPEPPATPDPLRPVLDEALALAAAYARAAVAQPGLAARLTPLGDDHRQHADALARVVRGKTAPPSAGTGAAVDGDVLAALRTAEQAAQKTAAAACRQAPAERAALVGSIAACRATHVEALR